MIKYITISLFILHLCIFSFIQNAFTQNVYISDPEKLSSEMIGFDILGKFKNGDVLIYKKYRYDDIIIVLDKEMKERRTKEITLKLEDYETIELIKLKDEIFQFYTLKANKNLYLYVQKYGLDLEKKDPPLVLDSTSLKLGENYSDFKIMKSKNEDFVLIYKYAYSTARIDKVNSIVMHRDGSNILSSTINLPDENFTPDLVKSGISNAGKAVFLFENSEFNCKKEKNNANYIFVIPQSGSEFIKTEIAFANDSLKSCIRKLNFEFDLKNGDLICIGIIGENTKDAMTGYYFNRLNTSTGNIFLQQTFAFSNEMLNEIEGIKERNEKYVPVFQITSITPRMDGGALLSAEYFEKSIENYETTNYDPYYGYRTSTRQIEYYEYSDILLLSLNPTGETDWSNLIRKKQLSKEDKGVNSSFALANCKESLFYIFNEDITQNSNVIQYQVTADGMLDRKSLFNPNLQEVELRNTSAKQIAFNEIIIPSVYKRTISFVKIVF